MIVAYAPWSPQEMFDLTILAFNAADRLRVPVIVLADEVIGHMVERVVIPPPDRIQRWDRKRPKKAPNGPFDPFKIDGDDLVPPMVHAGDGYRVHYTGLTHNEHGYPDMTPHSHQALVTRLVEKVYRNADQIMRYEEYYLEDARIIVIAYGCTARSARQAVREARALGIQAGLLRLVTLWPFPAEKLTSLAGQAQIYIVAELNLGQISHEVERIVKKPVSGVHHAGGEMISPNTILEEIIGAA
jgi:2-oxoglutarate ferredoxin oxidoreductase subunit alpha